MKVEAPGAPYRFGDCRNWSNNKARVDAGGEALERARAGGKRECQEAGIAMLVGLGVQVMTSCGDDLTECDDEMRVAMCQIVGVFS